MSIYSTRLTKELRKEVFSGNPVPEDWMPEGTWREGADYICLVLKNSVVPGAFQFVSAGDRLVRAIPVELVDPMSSRTDVFKARRGRGGQCRADGAGTARGTGQEGCRGRPGILKAVCDRLESLLIDDDAEAVDVLDENADLLYSAFPKHYRKIESDIYLFNFEAALVALRDATATSS